MDRIADERFELGMGLRRHAGTIAPDEAPQRLGVLRIRGRNQREQHRERDRHVGLRAARRRWMCQTGLDRRCFRVLPPIGFEELLIFVDVARNHVEIEPLCRLRLAIHEQRERLRRGVAQPFLDGQPVAPGLGNLLALLVEKKLVVEPFRRRAAERAADLARKLHRIDQVLARHLVVDAERNPAHGPIGLPLQLGAPAGDERGHRSPLSGSS